jgi:hypothetical protein
MSMITLTVDPQVLALLQADFPKPANSAKRALDKYIAALTAQLNQSVYQGRDPQQLKIQSYSVSTSKLANQGGQIGQSKTRVHSWLERKGVPLVRMVQKGSNLTGRLSDVVLTPLVQATEIWQQVDLDLKQATTDQQVEQALTPDQAQAKVVFDMVYPTFDSKWTGQDIAQRYDVLKVDVPSLKAYLYWLRTSTSTMTKDAVSRASAQARSILAVTSVLGGKYLQPIKDSAFGRRYYTGTSVQNVNKNLRNAILGSCWEYDIRSSVVAWKMGSASTFLQVNGRKESVRDAFPNTLLYLEDRTDFLQTVRLYVFEDRSEHNSATHMKMLKQAFTAIAFGARTNTKGWRTEDGSWVNPALVQVIRNPVARERFMADVGVRGFIKEQQALDGYFMEQVSAHSPDLLRKSILQTTSGKPSKSKVVAYLYQHSETEVMNVLRATVAQWGRVPLANVHDAIFFKQRLGVDRVAEAQYQMQQATGNPYWKLTATQHSRWEMPSLDEATELVAHRQRIAAETERAKTYEPKNF